VPRKGTCAPKGYSCPEGVLREYKIHKGKIKKPVHDRGFGFISDTDGREVFFHQSSLVDVSFDALNEDENVAFEVQKADNGSCAVNVSIAK